MSNNTSKVCIMPLGKEHQLVATEEVKVGEVIIAETPLVSVPDAIQKYSTFAWDLVDRILSSTSLTQLYFALKLKATKWLMDADDQRIERELAKKHRCTRDFVKNLYFSVCTNNVGYCDSKCTIIGHGIYPIISGANHSCLPNAAHEPGNLTEYEVNLVAIRDIQPGDAVTWSYNDEPEFMNSDYVTRNFNLMRTFRFVCRCERCQRELPLHLAGLKSLPNYFDSLIREDLLNSFKN